MIILMVPNHLITITKIHGWSLTVTEKELIYIIKCNAKEISKIRYNLSQELESDLLFWASSRWDYLLSLDKKLADKYINKSAKNMFYRLNKKIENNENSVGLFNNFTSIEGSLYLSESEVYTMIKNKDERILIEAKNLGTQNQIDAFVNFFNGEIISDIAKKYNVSASAISIRISNLVNKLCSINKYEILNTDPLKVGKFKYIKDINISEPINMNKDQFFENLKDVDKVFIDGLLLFAPDECKKIIKYRLDGKSNKIIARLLSCDILTVQKTLDRYYDMLRSNKGLKWLTEPSEYI